MRWGKKQQKIINHIFGKAIEDAVSSTGQAPGGAGSPVYTPAPAKPVVKSNGMDGFSEKGEPDEWDMAIGEVYGYRWWQISLPAHVAGFLGVDDVPIESPGLVGQNGHLWQPGKHEAKCTRSGGQSWEELIVGQITHMPPEARVACGCGFWAYFDPQLDVSSHFGNLNKDQPYQIGWTVQLAVFGVVKGTGRVIIGEKGFRSQYAEIVGLALPDFVKAQLGYYMVAGTYNNGHYSFTHGNGSHSTFNAMRSQAPASFSLVRPNLYGNGALQVVDASKTEVLARCATIEALLHDGYPDVKLFSDTDALTKYFPPDKNYA